MPMRQKVRDMMWEFPHFLQSALVDFLSLYERIEVSLLFHPAVEILHFFFFPSVSFTFSFLLPVQGKVRGLLAQLLCWKLRTRSLFLVLLLVGKWRIICRPISYRIQN